MRLHLSELVRRENVRTIAFELPSEHVAQLLTHNDTVAWALGILSDHGFDLALHAPDRPNPSISDVPLERLFQHDPSVSPSKQSLKPLKTLRISESVRDGSSRDELHYSASLTSRESFTQIAREIIGRDIPAQSDVRLFGTIEVSRRQIFYQTARSFGMVNLKPIVPGHVLMIPKRRVTRFEDMGADEVADLWCATQRVGATIQRHYKATSLTFAVQDGPEAGQTIDHVHIHILPRRVGDFPQNDDIYGAIESRETAGRPPRSVEEMAAEAEMLQPYFF